jgi:hypothetical protein
VAPAAVATRKSIVQTAPPGAITARMKNPFPGMNPWLEEFWRDVHASVLVLAREQLNTRLTGDLSARVD